MKNLIIYVLSMVLALLTGTFIMYKYFVEYLDYCGVDVELYMHKKGE